MTQEQAYKIEDNGKIKILRSPEYNYAFNKVNGRFMRWGKTKNDDPNFCPFGPEIADIEITTACNGIPNAKGQRRVCSFCYKSNTPKGTYMSFETFKDIFHKLPDTLTQIAFGVDAQFLTNPDSRKIFEYSRANGVIPNVTVADVDEDTAKCLAETCGAGAVSRYADKNICYNTIERLAKYGLRQINIHIMLSKETEANLWETMNDFKTDPRLKHLNAIVILSLKKKGRGEVYNQVSQEAFKKIVDFALAGGIPIGFDSCSCPKFLKSVDDSPNKEFFQSVSEPCESGLFSMYIDVEGIWHPCSFMADTGSWTQGIDMKKVNDFLSEVWYNSSVEGWRNKLLAKNRECPEFTI